jgi:hypothetical protein
LLHASGPVSSLGNKERDAFAFRRVTERARLRTRNVRRVCVS